MFNWFKSLVAGTKSPQQGPSAPAVDLRATIQVVSVWSVADNFLSNNPAPPDNGVQALVDAGAANLLDSSELLKVCDKIKEHGYRNPLNPTLMNELSKVELLEFVRWHGQHRVEAEYYANEQTIHELIDRFRDR